MAEVTVVIPTRDRWPLLARAVASVLGQRAVDVRVLVVDNSPSEPPPRAGALADPRVSILRRPGVGLGAVRNHGIAAVKSEWTALLDDDDVWAPDKLARQLETAEAGGAGAVYASAYAVAPDLSVEAVLPALEPAELRGALARYNAVPAGASNVVVQTRALRSLGGFDESFHHLADWDLWLRLADALVLAAVPEPLVAYVQHPANMVAREPRRLLAEYARLRRKHRGFAQRHGTPFRHDELLRWYADRLRLAGARRRAAAVLLEGGLRYRDPRAVVRGARLLRRAPRVTPAPRATLPAPAWLEALAERGASA